MKPIAVVDFESERIERRPKYPPKPVGVAIGGDGLKPIYYAWGHPSGNNTDKRHVMKLLKDLYRSHTIIFHHSAFDCEVGHEYMDLPLTPESYEDTMFLAFLYDPRAEDLGLKSLAEKLLGVVPRERDKLRNWIVKNIAGANEKTWGEYISKAPAELVAPYAEGDVTRPLKLRKFFHEELALRDKKYPPLEGQCSQWDAYQRELKLMPTILRMEARGVRVDIPRLERDIPKWGKAIEALDKWIIAKLGGARRVAQFAKDGEGFKINSPTQLADALEAAGLVTTWIKTAKGNRSTKRENLIQVLKDKKLIEALSKRTILEKYISTYGNKWIEFADKDGFVYPRINQVRNSEDEYRDNNTGTRTGRLSYSDSWQAIANPKRIPYPDLPVLRNYIIPDEPGHVIILRDYSQQEYRILGHYEDGALKLRYQADPTIDMHDEARMMINELIGILYDRRPVKDTGFGLIYGLGVSALAKKLNLSEEDTRKLKSAYLKAIPGLKGLMDSIKERCKNNEPIRTWGGRLYWVEPPAFSKKFNKIMSFDYKMLNVLIQGSAGDCTKEAMIRTDERTRAKSGQGRLLMQQHDELVMSVPKNKKEYSMKILREAMESVEFDIPMLSDGSWSPKSWGEVKKYKE